MEDMEGKNGFHSGFVTLIGRPNVGKSTLMNHLIGQKIAITSAKPQTTRNRIQTVYTDEQGQIIFLDTPGILKARHKLDEYMLETAEETLAEVDAVLWLVEPASYVGEGDQYIAKILAAAKKPVILVINKIDQADKEKPEEAKNAFSGLMDFAGIAEVSALRGIGVDALRRKIMSVLPVGPQFFDEETVTNQSMREIAAEIVREKALRLLKEEVPHGIAVVIDSMKQRGNGLWDIDASIVCEKDSHKGIVIGKGGAMLKRIGSQARKDIEDMVQDQVNLQLHVKVRKDWRDSELYMKNFGYEMKNGKK
ncbi:GTP-binding protein Era [[Clostridium] aminophilum]|uniref:GTPase Era n=2 Tax=[Clostridium] aminophilum TaxID=1526 RepID=A0A1I0D2Z4_9FIRM|nr:GTPase Era [[Clostridium] aminophilum]SET26286.1 GTP-binding protein Era [[Clostridium] aminophilum]